MPLIIGGAVGALAILGIVIGVVFTMQGSEKKLAAKKEQEQAAKAAKEKAEADKKKAEEEDEPKEVAFSLKKLALLRPRALTLEVKTAQSTEVATCFLIGDGLALAPYHVVANAISAEAITAADERITVTGITNIDAAHDLAIVKFDPKVKPEKPLEKLELNVGEPTADADIGALDITSHDMPAVRGKFQSSDTFAKVSPTVQARLKALVAEWNEDDTSIVKHDIKLPPQGIGAPILNHDGKVIGIHLAGDTTHGYALHVRHAKLLVDKPAGEFKPFASTLAANEKPPVEPPPTTPEETEPKPAVARPEDPTDDFVLQIKEAGDECEKFNWVAKDEKSYGAFQQFAKLVNEAAEMAASPALQQGDIKKLTTAAREAIGRLNADNFPEEEHWKETNQQAIAGLKTPSQGIFARGRVTQPATSFNNVPTLIIELVGTDSKEQIVMPLKNGSDKFAIDDHILIIGVHDPQPVKLTNPDGGQTAAQLVRTKFAIADVKE